MAEQTQQFIEALSGRETEVLFAMAEGMNNREIANTLHMALATVKSHNTNIYSKLYVSNREEAIKKARSLGLLDSDNSQTSDTANNLPRESTIFIGRNNELRELHDLLNRDETNLITILAQGGTGKTRLAIQLAKHNLSNFSDGIYLIELAPLEQATAVPLLVNKVLGLQYYDTESSTEDSIIKYLKSQQILLIFDNFEHVLDSASLVSKILKSAPQVKVIVTSRERLNLQGEIVYTLSGMATDENDEALELFLQSTWRNLPDYEVSDADLTRIIEICRLVDGLPLGIELAAGWMDTLSAQELLREIQSSITILETELRDVPERHRSIRATFDYTWQRLSKSEQETMMCLSLFRGGFTPEASREVAMADIRRLKHLLNKSLLYRDPFGRYSIHELLRQYCADKLDDSGEYDRVVEAFMLYFASFTEKRIKLHEEIEGFAVKDIEIDWDNIAFAWHLMLSSGRFDLIEECLYSIWMFASVRGYSYEGVELFDNAINQLRKIIETNQNLRPLLGSLLGKRANLRTGIGEEASTQQDLDEAIALLEEEAPSLALLDSYYTHFMIFRRENNHEKNISIASKMIRLAKQLNRYHFVISANSRLYHDSLDSKYLEIVYEIWKTHKEGLLSNSLSKIHYEVADTLIRLGKTEEALPVIEEAIFHTERLEWIFGISISRAQMGWLAYETGNREELKRQMLAILRWHQTHARDWQMLGALDTHYGLALWRIGHYEKSAEVYGFIHNHPLTVERVRVSSASIIEDLKLKLDEETFVSAWERGKDKTLKEMVAEAMAYWSS